MVFSADTLRDIIDSNWALTGRLAKVPADNMKEIVFFYAYPQVLGNETTKAVTIQKINALENERVVAHPKHNQVSDIFEIEIRYRTFDVQLINRDIAYSDLEDMADEVVRILKTQFQPSSDTGAYYQVSREWQRLDEYSTQQPDLRRRLRFTLTTLTTDSTEVYRGFGGVLVYDRSQGTGSQPGADYEYSEVFNVKHNGGFKIIKELTRSSFGIPKRFVGKYEGTFSFETRAKQSDIANGSTTNLLDNIGDLLANDELPEVFLVQTVNNENNVKLNQTTKILVTDFQQLYDVEELVAFMITGDVFEPPVFTKS